MKWKSLVFVAIMVCSGTISADDNSDLIMAGTSGTNILFAVLRENGSQLKLANRASFPALGTVGTTSLLSSPGDEEEMKAFYTFSDKKQHARCARLDANVWNQGGGTPILSKEYPQILSSYANLGIFQTSTGTYLYRTKTAPKEDQFAFLLNSSFDPTGGGRKLLDNVTGAIPISTSINDEGSFGASSVIDPSHGNMFVALTAEGPIIKSKTWFLLKSEVVNVSVSNATTAGNPLVVVRDLAVAGGKYQSSVTVRPFDKETSQPGVAKKLAGPSNLSGGPGAYDYTTLFFNTSAISPDGEWAFYTKPGPGCGLVWEMWARRLSPAGGFAGPQFRPFGTCNKLLGDGTAAVVVRSISLRRRAPSGGIGSAKAKQ